MIIDNCATLSFTRLLSHLLPGYTNVDDTDMDDDIKMSPSSSSSNVTSSSGVGSNSVFDVPTPKKYEEESVNGR